MLVLRIGAIIQLTYIFVSANLFLLWIAGHLPIVPSNSTTVLSMILVVFVAHYIATWVTNRSYPTLTRWALSFRNEPPYFSLQRKPNSPILTSVRTLSIGAAPPLRSRFLTEDSAVVDGPGAAP